MAQGQTIDPIALGHKSFNQNHHTVMKVKTEKNKKTRIISTFHLGQLETGKLANKKEEEKKEREEKT